MSADSDILPLSPSLLHRHNFKEKLTLATLPTD